MDLDNVSICPITKVNCLYDDCAWYSKDNAQCIIFAVGSIAGSLDDLSQVITHITVKPNQN